MWELTFRDLSIDLSILIDQELFLVGVTFLPLFHATAKLDPNRGSGLFKEHPSLFEKVFFCAIEKEHDRIMCKSLKINWKSFITCDNKCGFFFSESSY